MTERCGILCIDKPQGFTSFDVVAKLRGIAKTRRVGHAGTLDPMATGVLPVFFGRATKAADLLPNQEKRYTATFRLGLETDTYDVTGRVLRECPVAASAAEVRAAAARFRGAFLQLPPMYSAVQVNGRRLYELARQGLEVERAPRPVEISRLEFLACDERTHAYTIDVCCSKGTYIRSLVHDIGQALGCGAALAALRRTEAAGFSLERCVTLEEAARRAEEGSFDGLLLPVEAAFAALPRATLTERQAHLFQNGARLDLARVESPPGRVAVYSREGLFLGLADAADGELRLVKLFALEG